MRSVLAALGSAQKRRGGCVAACRRPPPGGGCQGRRCTGCRWAPASQQACWRRAGAQGPLPTRARPHQAACRVLAAWAPPAGLPCQGRAARPGGDCCRGLAPTQTAGWRPADGGAGGPLPRQRSKSPVPTLARILLDWSGERGSGASAGLLSAGAWIVGGAAPSADHLPLAVRERDTRHQPNTVSALQAPQAAPHPLRDTDARLPPSQA